MRELSAMTLYGKQAAELEYQAPSPTAASPAPRAASRAAAGHRGRDGPQAGRGRGRGRRNGPAARHRSGPRARRRRAAVVVEPPAYQREGGGEGGEEGDGVAASGSFVGAQEGAMGRDEAYAALKAEGAEEPAAAHGQEDGQGGTLERAELAAQVNAARAQSTASRTRSRPRRRSAPFNRHHRRTEIIDEEEYAFIQEMRVAKSNTRSATSR